MPRKTWFHIGKNQYQLEIDPPRPGRHGVVRLIHVRDTPGQYGEHYAHIGRGSYDIGARGGLVISNASVVGGKYRKHHRQLIGHLERFFSEVHPEVPKRDIHGWHERVIIPDLLHVQMLKAQHGKLTVDHLRKARNRPRKHK
ncbi:MAG: hypothetical protein JXB14_06720 [Candidatus Altiarchaeota archaeon]|nr:hypothetical protein [Candidatus Altiarchaeota archaeon]